MRTIPVREINFIKKANVRCLIYQRPATRPYAACAKPDHGQRGLRSSDGN